MRVALVCAALSLGVTQTALSLEFTLAGERHVLRAANLAAQTRGEKKTSATHVLQLAAQEHQIPCAMTSCYSKHQLIDVVAHHCSLTGLRWTGLGAHAHRFIVVIDDALLANRAVLLGACC